MPGIYKKLDRWRKNKYIRAYTYTFNRTTIEFVDGYYDPSVVHTGGIKYKGIKKVIVGNLFLLGKIF